MVYWGEVRYIFRGFWWIGEAKNSPSTCYLKVCLIGLFSGFVCLFFFCFFLGGLVLFSLLLLLGFVFVFWGLFFCICPTP